jgi:hypothetical protein
VRANGSALVNGSGPGAADRGSGPSRSIFERSLWKRRTCAQALDISLATFARMEAARKVGPVPLRLAGGCVRYRAGEMLAWVEAGCPDRETWQALRSAEANRKGGRTDRTT